MSLDRRRSLIALFHTKVYNRLLVPLTAANQPPSATGTAGRATQRGEPPILTTAEISSVLNKLSGGTGGGRASPARAAAASGVPPR